MSTTFNPVWNPHYNFNDPASRSEITAVDSYDLNQDRAIYEVGQVISSPWGSNQVLEVRHEHGEDVCLKKITVNPGYMLSLQRHRGRVELWDVACGTPTIMINGETRTVRAGESVTLPKGVIHCLINSSDQPVIILETQRGICRERDSVRLVDFNDRPTYPLTSEVEFLSARLYARIHEEHAQRYGFNNRPSAALLA